MFGCLGNALSPGIRKEVNELIQTSGRVLVQVRMPRCDQRNPKGMSDPKTQHPHIPWPSNVNQIGTEIAELISDPTLKPAQEGITVKMVVQWERRQTSFQLRVW